MKKQKETKLTQFSSVFQKVDLFGTDVSFRENGKDHFTTNCGAITSILIIALVVIYGYEKFLICSNREDNTQ